MGGKVREDFLEEATCIKGDREEKQELPGQAGVQRP